MKGIAFLALAALFFAVLIGAAFAWDSVRILDAAWRDVDSARSELKRLDERIVRAKADLDAAPGDEAIRRRAADEYAGSQNRRAVAERRHDELLQIYVDKRAGLMGRTAQKFASFPEPIPDRMH